MSNHFDQVPFGQSANPFDPRLAENPEPRCLCVLLLDTSFSMSGEPIRQLNEGLINFKDELMADSMAVKRVEIAIVTFGPVQTVTDFQTPDEFHPPVLQASGGTPMGEAVETAIRMISERKNILRLNGISPYRPWIFLLTDGAPTDSYRKAIELVKQGEEAKSFMLFAVGVDGANMDILSQISTRQPLNLNGLRFRELFSWLSSSLGSVSQSAPEDKVQLTNPITPGGWASV